MEFTIRNQLSEIETVTAQVQTFAETHSLPPKLVFQLTLALEELVTNMISYGYEDEAPHEIQIRLHREGDRLHVQLVDDAKPFNPLEVPPPDLTLPLEERPIGGLGIHLVRTMFSHLTYRRESGRNILDLEQRIAADTV